ncbi:Phage integrase family protein [Enterovibrio nigricans DSM 22720]|uniref:Phage integrase family protein n=1 Tax=Enterovibrio nigricans DSM 22720 TaxID=1121868 RepID=A0A1T4WJE4_9GAMM|nr:Phage integrase family protein [Enterovibrio nigricans DSM 22720]
MGQFYFGDSVAKWISFKSALTALPAKICKHLKPRVIWLSNPKTRRIIQEWINYRKTKSWAVTKSNEYQGLNPESRFLLNNRGRSYALQPKPRVMLDGEVKTYWACDSLEQSFRKLYARCGLHTASSHTGRKSLVTNAIIRGESLENMARVIGHSSTETTLKYVVIQRDRIREMCAIDWL